MLKRDAMMKTVDDELQSCLVTGGHVHLVGICGIGMAGLAVLLKQRGCRVSGCDHTAETRIGRWLSSRGIEVIEGHDASHVTQDVDWVVRTAAVNEQHDEICAARQCALPVFRRGEVLPRLLEGVTSVAVSGTHGKTTTSTFVAQLLNACDVKTAWCIGGEIESLGGVAGSDAAEVLVVEADESDGTVALYSPDIAIVTNIEFDHMEHFENVADFESCFSGFISQSQRRVIYGGDDPRAAALCASVPGARSYGESEGVSLRVSGINCETRVSTFTLLCEGRDLGVFAIPVAGVHNVMNAVAAIGVALELGVSPEHIREGLNALSLPRRRFERVACRDGVTVVSDYAHHPSEIVALVKMAGLQKSQRLRMVYQPHRYTRTRALGADFPSAFDGVDEVILVPVYAASESPLPGGTTADLYARFYGAPQHGPKRLMLADSVEEAGEYYRRTLQPGDMLLVTGAGDVERLAFDMQQALEAEQVGFQREGHGETVVALPIEALRDSEVRQGFPMRRITSFGVGGEADCLVDVGSIYDLAVLLRWTEENGLPLRLLGGGFNVLASDLGVSGVVVRLRGEAFRHIVQDGEVIRIGAGVSLSRLLDWAEENGLAGLENLEGIPGTVGGACRMNAGAHGSEIGDHLLWIRCLKSDGREHIVSRERMGLAYRTCDALRDALCVEVALQLPAGDRKVIQARRKEVSERRVWMASQRSAGSVFKNPPGDFAGRLLEGAGYKGVQLGGAGTAPSQANFLSVDKSACASDVLALMQQMQMAVAMRYGVELETEIRFFGLMR
ncbi:MAG: UDP-N-acetylmuramate--L-alanine ligase [Kiritimatiellae bacterium]|nr:UDP-N-acetylmuramate--L-alanine ligase [Kiritimatiellia bacterium]